MTLEDFPETNTVIARNQPEYFPMPAHSDPDDKTGRTTILWRLTVRERWKIFLTGKI